MGPSGFTDDSCWHFLEALRPVLPKRLGMLNINAHGLEAIARLPWLGTRLISVELNGQKGLDSLYHSSAARILCSGAEAFRSLELVQFSGAERWIPGFNRKVHVARVGMLPSGIISTWP